MNDRAVTTVANPPTSGAAGFSLLEVILALAILAGAIAVLGEVTRMGMRNARVARNTTKAQLLCETKMAEITSGLTPATPVHGAAFDGLAVTGQTSGIAAAAADENQWIYSIDTMNLDEDGLMIVTVAVSQDPNLVKRPVQVKLVRWILDAYAGESTAGESGEGSSGMGGGGE